MEQIDLASADQVKPGTTFYKVLALDLNWGGKTIEVTLTGADGIQRTFRYSGTMAETMMIALNKADLSVKSLHRRILERLMNDGLLSGTITGLPD